MLAPKKGLGRLVDVRPDEVRAVLYAFAYFFCVLASYYLLRPLREAMGIVGNVKDLSHLFLVTLTSTLLFTPVLTALGSRFPRRTFIPVLYRFFALNLVVFFALLRGPSVHPNVARAFFVWTSVFNLFALSIFWGFMADLFRREQGLRLFGFIGAGGTVGAVVGSFATAALAERIGAAPLLLGSAALLEAAVQCVLRLARLSTAPTDRAEDDAHGLREGGVLRWALRLVRTPYFLAIIAYMLLFTFTSTFVYFEQARIVKSALASTDARTALFARMDLAVNVLSIALQAVIVGPLLRALGVGKTLAILPLLTIAGFVALRVTPSLGVLVVFQVARRAADYGIAKPAREVLFTVVSRADKYKAKTFIDTFVYRGGDALGAVAFDGLASALGAGLVAVSVPVCAAWAGLALALGRARPPPTEVRERAPTS